jgi:hypothetical protein
LGDAETETVIFNLFLEFKSKKVSFLSKNFGWDGRTDGRTDKSCQKLQQRRRKTVWRLWQLFLPQINVGFSVSQKICTPNKTHFPVKRALCGPPLKLVKYLPHNCDLSSAFIRGNRLICVLIKSFVTFVPKNDALASRGPHKIIEPKYGDKCTRQDFLTRQEKKEPVGQSC